MATARAIPPHGDWSRYNEARLTEKLYFVERWKLAELYSQLFRSKVWQQTGKRPTVENFVRWVNDEMETDYEQLTLMHMIDVYNAYSRLPQDGVPARVREIGFEKAAAAIPYVMKFPNKADAIFAICGGADDLADMKRKLWVEFPLKRA